MMKRKKWLENSATKLQKRKPVPPNILIHTPRYSFLKKKLEPNKSVVIFKTKLGYTIDETGDAGCCEEQYPAFLA